MGRGCASRHHPDVSRFRSVVVQELVVMDENATEECMEVLSDHPKVCCVRASASKLELGMMGSGQAHAVVVLARAGGARTAVDLTHKNSSRLQCENNVF